MGWRAAVTGGHALETVVLLELQRRGAEVGYLRKSSGFEVAWLLE